MAALRGAHGGELLLRGAEVEHTFGPVEGAQPALGLVVLGAHPSRSGIPRGVLAHEAFDPFGVVAAARVEQHRGGKLGAAVAAQKVRDRSGVCKPGT